MKPRKIGRLRTSPAYLGRGNPALEIGHLPYFLNRQGGQDRQARESASTGSGGDRQAREQGRSASVGSRQAWGCREMGKHGMGGIGTHGTGEV